MRFEQAQKTRLARGKHWYVVYLRDNSERFVQAYGQSDAELVAGKQYPGNLGVSYTEL